MISNDYKTLAAESSNSRFAAVSSDEAFVEHPLAQKMRESITGPYVSFDTWENLPSNFKLTKGECNQLYNIITWANTENLYHPDLKSVTPFLNKIAEKLQREI